MRIYPKTSVALGWGLRALGCSPRAPVLVNRRLARALNPEPRADNSCGTRLRAGQAGHRGSLLVVTLWIVIILGALAVASARYLSTEIRLTKYYLSRSQAQALARSGVYLAMRMLQEDATPADWAGETWAIPQTLSPGAGQRLVVSMTDEERKLNVNSATPSQLELLLGSGELIAQLLDYRDAAESTTDRPTDHPPYYAKNGPIAALEELSDLPAMDEHAYDALSASMSPHTMPGAPCNINTVTPAVMAALGVTSDGVERVRAFRDGPDGPDAHEADGVFEQAQLINTLEGLGLDGADIGKLSGMTTSSQTFLVVSEAVMERPVLHLRVHAVLQRSGPDRTVAPRIIAWREG